MSRILKPWSDKEIEIACDRCGSSIHASEIQESRLIDHKRYCKLCVEPILTEKVVNTAILFMENTNGLQLSADPDLLQRYLNLRKAVDAINKL